eukprot:TRINITY_DN24096_c0_g2_i1.p1 TRINITY_DN24096_c0_g2~~TRINITY_DN24096_c0_g2_i1.p1  ORF type:complete len:443 (+),score=60.84 TRINITY_DN24096_c0_g2_i1:57-1385(+)
MARLSAASSYENGVGRSQRGAGRNAPWRELWPEPTPLRRLGQAADIPADAAETGGVRAVDFSALDTKDVLATMAKNIGVAEVQESGCQTLQSLDLRRDRSQDKFIRAVLRAMSAHAESVQVQNEGCKALACFVDSPKVTMLRLDARDAQLAAVVTAKEVDPGMVETAASKHGDACTAARAVLCSQAEIVALGGIKAVLYALELHSGSADVKLSACNLLYLLTLHNPNNQVRVAREGGLNALVSVLNGDPSSPVLTSIVCKALHSLALDVVENRHLIVARGGASSVLDVMSSLASVQYVQEAACDLLAILALEPDLQISLCAAGAVDAALLAAEMHSDDSTLLLKVFDLLLALGASNMANQSRIVSRGAPEAIVRAATRHQDCPDVQVRCCRLACQIGTSLPSCKLKLQTLGAINLFEQAFARHPGNRELEAATAQVLRLLKR